MSVRFFPGRPVIAFAVLCALAVGGCTTSKLITPSGEAELGGEFAEQVEQSIGLVESPVLESYVAAIGARLAGSSPEVRGEIDYTFKIVDMAEPNAFALPGGYIYVSRGLLAILNTETELANVLAHEVAHVSARHHLRHALRQAPLLPVRIVTGIGAFATSIVSRRLANVISLAGQAPGTLILASHSRGQESEADELGQAFAAAAGWDPKGMAQAMDALTRDVAVHGGDPSKHSFFATHPTTPDRSRNALERAATIQRSDQPAIARTKRDFLSKLDGLIVGRAAREGVFVANEFLHADLGLRVAFPAGWKGVDDGTNVRATSPEEDAVSTLTIAGQGDDPLPIARAILEKSRIDDAGEPESRSIGGLEAARVEGRLREDGRSYRIQVDWIAHGGLVYQVTSGALDDAWLQRRADLVAVPESFRPITRAERSQVREGRLRIIEARADERLPAVLERIDGSWTLEEVSAANDLASDTLLARGQLLKASVLEVYVPDSGS